MTMSTRSKRQGLEREQLESLNHLLRRVGETNGFYRPILQEAGLADGVEDVRVFSERMPFTTKDSIAEDQQLHPPYGTNLTCPVEQYSRFNQDECNNRPTDSLAGYDGELAGVVGQLEESLRCGRSGLGQPGLLCVLVWTVSRVLDRI